MNSYFGAGSVTNWLKHVLAIQNEYTFQLATKKPQKLIPGDSRSTTIRRIDFFGQRRARFGII
jgi:hypothetical protein